jgi:Flp pilus assembly protein TadG
MACAKISKTSVGRTMLSTKFRGQSKAATTFHRFRANEDGVTAIEFGMVAFPFLLFVLGILAVGLQFFTINILDSSVETAARRVRTGQAQSANLTMGDFKNLICQATGGILQPNCNDIYVHVQSGNSWADIVPRVCAENGQMTPQSNTTAALADSSGGSEQVVLVTVCYDWKLPVDFPYLQYLLMRPADGVALASGGSLIQSVATFRTEPYE